MTPLERYQADLKRPDFFHDAAQENAVRHLQRLYDDLVASSQAGTGLLGKLFGKKRQGPVKGVYFWGGVGRGKTYLVDTFFDALPFEQKMRTHFHRFMKRVHEEMKTLKGEKNPLTIIGKRFADEARVICFDEFFVSDITDAMILATLLDELFKNGVSLVATSNIVPDGLYKDGLQRARFLPAIDLLQTYCVVLRSDGQEDYRLRALTRSPVYRTPLDGTADDWLAMRWRELSGGEAAHGGNIEIDSRKIPVRGRGKSIAWFDFAALCEGPRGTTDYIEIAHEFNTVLVGGIPRFDALNEDAARRFVNLIDELYDRHVNLVCTAADAPTALYTGTRLQGAFERTASRLIEMQSAEYLATPHKA